MEDIKKEGACALELSWAFINMLFWIYYFKLDVNILYYEEMINK